MVVAQQRANRERRGRDLTPAELETIADASVLAEWCAAAWVLLDQPGVTRGSIARALDILPSSVGQRLSRHPRA